jgi:hypothetical protein
MPVLSVSTRSVKVPPTSMPIRHGAASDEASFGLLFIVVPHTADYAGAAGRMAADRELLAIVVCFGKGPDARGSV